MFDGLQILSNTTKRDQTHTNMIKPHQTRCPNGKMFGRQTMFDGVWSPNIYRFVQALTDYGLITRFNSDTDKTVYFISIKFIPLKEV